MAAPHPLSIPAFRAFFLARFLATGAVLAMVVILGWQVYDVARSDYGMSPKEAAFQLAVLGAVQFLPLFLLTPVAGLAADRFERRTIARMANSIDLSVALMLGIVTYFNWINLPILFGLSAMHGAARSFVGPSMSAIAPNIVPAEVLPKAIAFNSIAWQSASVIGPAVAGFIYANSPSSPYFVAAALLAIANLALTFLPPVYPPEMLEKPHPIQQMKEGLFYTIKDKLLLGAITLDLFAVLLGGANALLPVYARDILHVGTQGLGQMRAAPAFGAALVAIYLGVNPVKHNVGIKMLWGVALFGAATIGFGYSHLIGPLLSNAKTVAVSAFGIGSFDLSPSLIVALLMLALIGAADMMSVFVRSSLVQLNTPDDKRGRVSAISGVAISASNELGEFQSGLAAAILGPVGAVVFGGAGAIIITGVWAWVFPELRNARTFEPQYRQKQKEPET